MILKHLKIVYMIITYDFRNESKPASLRGAQEVYSVVLGNSRSRGAGHGGAWRGMAGRELMRDGTGPASKTKMFSADPSDDL